MGLSYLDSKASIYPYPSFQKQFHSYLFYICWNKGENNDIPKFWKKYQKSYSESLFKLFENVGCSIIPLQLPFVYALFICCLHVSGIVLVNVP